MKLTICNGFNHHLSATDVAHNQIVIGDKRPTHPIPIVDECIALVARFQKTSIVVFSVLQDYVHSYRDYITGFL